MPLDFPWKWSGGWAPVNTIILNQLYYCVINTTEQVLIKISLFHEKTSLIRPFIVLHSTRTFQKGKRIIICFLPIVIYWISLIE